MHYNDLDAAINLCLNLQESGASQVYMSKTDRQSAFCVATVKILLEVAHYEGSGSKS